ncbi:protein containing duf1501 : Uncharacterized protein OS=Singulisphaera acidiphila (strain ATCC BAA-1392 / DSM 18658 / VKM B-2454 / MOB10) GN=Sinac_5270 PE=4 SV=1: DUF1501: DUF1501 [Gemmata massiliana]|uniref:DUF1501 domain-containing protein n=1 Tax=Gemmata massiliana TaxID=1210884 RepID=A0A6P2DEB0_9BACT|nr:DUF1501 domain-containing protein [Gemmata massiliana]VTR99793.1 protein containing duf1501 : Uncharacterized protein OS=Singulisphaera acidiphila (strain ATCC BAA-1392 / DSM 18658 / VKM B-2454 / MOB10) GN=Sinac_5270 PE=4 SV=1: DUF1501: DUF1501 [Gemmata massiliana]
MSETTPTRRDFLRTTVAGAAGLALAGAASGNANAPAALGNAKSCIFINMVGGPAHLDTLDPKPDAPSDVRGPFRPIQTATPGTHLSELFPKLAKLTGKFSLIRSMYHDAPPVHECGFQLLNTGRLFRDGPEWPSMGAVVTQLFGERDYCPPWWHYSDGDVVTGISVSHGQGAGFLPIPDYWPYRPDLSRYPFEIACDSASAVIRTGARFITINQFSTVFDAPSWDCHADGGSLRTTLGDVRDAVAPSFDAAVARLITDLEDRGLLESTLVVATGEFGRTPKLNSNGGRDHWAGCWTALVAGGGVKGGRVIGASDRTGSEPSDRPVSPQELVSSIFHALGVPHNATIPGPSGAPVAVYPGAPVAELF